MQDRQDAYDYVLSAAGESPPELWTALLNLTELVYQEPEGTDVPVTQEMLHDYYAGLR